MSKVITNKIESLETQQSFDVRDLANIAGDSAAYKLQIYEDLKISCATHGFNLVGTFATGTETTSSYDVVWDDENNVVYRWFDGSAQSVTANSKPVVDSTHWVAINFSCIKRVFLYDEIIALPNLPNLFDFRIQDKSNARYIIRSTQDTLPGDILLPDGRVCELQCDSDSAYDVSWFGVVNDTDDTIGNQITLFESAASHAFQRTGIVKIPSNMRVELTGDPLAYDITWLIGQNFVISNGPIIAPTNVYDLSILGGKVEVHFSLLGRSFKYVGDGGYTFQKVTHRAMTRGVISTGSHNGSAGACNSTATSLNSATSPNQGSIGHVSKCVVDNSSVGHSGWGGYDETIKTSSNAANAFGRETSVSTAATASVINPYTDLNLNMNLIIGHSITYGLEQYNKNISAVQYWSKTCGGVKAHKGLVVMQESIAEGAYLAEVVCMPNNHGFGWYGSDGNLAAYLKFLEIDTENTLILGVKDSSLAAVKTLKIQFDNITYGSGSSYLGTDIDRFAGIYLTNSPDVSSDQNLKKVRGELSDAEMRAAIKISRMPKMFQWLREFDNTDSPDLHCSPMAQSVWEAFESEGIDPCQYGFIKNGDLNNTTWSIQPQELLWMISCSQQNIIDDIMIRLSNLERLNG